MAFRSSFPVWLLLLLPLFSISQQPVVKGWHLLDRETDGYYGISLEKAYEFLKGKKSVPVVVAIIDSGIDTTHEDLHPIIWKNAKEIAGNNIDDDKNGYADDQFGWNFLGNPNGENVEKESSEAARLYHKLSPVFENKMTDPNELDAARKNEYELWLQVSKAVQVTDEDRFLLKVINSVQRTLKIYDSIIVSQSGIKEYNALDLEAFHPTNGDGKKAKLNYLRIYDLLQLEPEMTNLEFMEEMSEFISSKEDLIYLKERPAVNYRNEITGDNDTVWTSRNFGNSDVMGKGALHGTHVAGIIGALRNNEKGINGIANNVKLMPIRVVPLGDEHDKDVALGIRYAVDNGARVINMSFGKPLSPQKQWVDEAIKYAASKNVLLVHAAGNDGLNLDTVSSYPSPAYNDGTFAPNFITVGASSDSSIKGGLIADFTNYGKKSVDVLAPGVKIFSTVPTGDNYSFQQGTSMAAPVVTGIAALLMSYYPNLTAVEIKQIIEASVDTFNSATLYPIPGGDPKNKMTIASSCRSGGVVNAYNAVRLAEDKSHKK